ncbi:TlpA family protein disulfide reductase [Qipengyuania zhejiangensis]|uniref:TlpA family protein disulfide reductase n=1 Tax=Qipengyuania zhejiangensis TaxID=3077782 RepID=UPI002D765872|nr:TlpA disulfide reductase family protein [Qipengyuania sp. Z2]
MSRLSLTLAVILGLSLAACDRGEPEKAQETTATPAPTGEIDRSHAGDLMPAANVRDPDGRTLNLGALQGTPVLLNLWATWCAPCVKEMPLLDSLSADYDEMVHVITVSQDARGAAVVTPFFAKGGYAYLEPWMDEEAELGFTLGGAQLPMTVLYDAMGQEVWRVTGDFDWSSEEARSAIDEAVS